MAITVENGNITDERGNSVRISHWGSEDAARAALETLIDCYNCSGCSDCRYCCNCSACIDCIDCSACSACSDCYDCRACRACSACSDCRDCMRCRDCRACIDCYDCRACSGSSDCRACIDCSDCRACIDCIDSSDCIDCIDCIDCSACCEGNKSFTVPVIADIHRKIYSEVSRPGALDMDVWHLCETTHCRAGWVVTLAGDAGRELEEKTCPLFAAQQIYKASGYKISPARFFDSNEDALADMKRMAGE